MLPALSSGFRAFRPRSPKLNAPACGVLLAKLSAPTCGVLLAKLSAPTCGVLLPKLTAPTCGVLLPKLTAPTCGVLLPKLSAPTCGVLLPAPAPGLKSMRSTSLSRACGSYLIYNHRRCATVRLPLQPSPSCQIPSLEALSPWVPFPSQ